MKLLDARLTVDYPGQPGVLRDFRFAMEPGEMCALAGESGSGKSTFALAALALLATRRARIEGHLLFQGVDLLHAPERQRRSLRGRQLAYVPQNPIAALHPYRTLGNQFEEAWLVHEPGRARHWREPAMRALQLAQLDGAEAMMRLYPRQLSTGMAQRVLIALALLHRCEAGGKLILADEATSALDVINGAAILDLFAALNREQGVAVLFITHDLRAAARLCHRIAVLHDGAVVEDRAPSELFADPRHAYTRALIQALSPAPPAA